MKAQPFNHNAPAVTSFTLPTRTMSFDPDEPLKGNVLDRTPSKFTPIVRDRDVDSLRQRVKISPLAAQSVGVGQFENIRVDSHPTLANRAFEGAKALVKRVL